MLVLSLQAWNLHAEPGGRGGIRSELAGDEHGRRSHRERGLLNQPPGNPLAPLLALHQLQAARVRLASSNFPIKTAIFIQSVFKF